jgi:ribosomal protein S18 acetylase RimI-like enzyme
MLLQVLCEAKRTNLHPFLATHLGITLYFRDAKCCKIIPVIASLAIDKTHIRPVDPRRDLRMISDLIEVCFADQMDEEGREYVRQIRHAAQEGDFFRWMYGADERISIPLGGYVWVEGQRVVGNLTLIPFRMPSGTIRWRYLIANVAVDPDFRRRGIARQLTLKALEHIHQRRADAWLQVREDNPPAYNLYLSLGFAERARRSTWEPANGAAIPELTSSILVTTRSQRDWPLQSAWLRQTYPPEVAWNLGFRLTRFEPGLWRGIINLLFDRPIYQWAVRRGGNLLGVASWEPGLFRGENLWLAADPDNEEEALFSLLARARGTLVTRHPLSINYPAGRGKIAFEQAGFVKQNTLIWMEIKYNG